MAILEQILDQKRSELPVLRQRKLPQPPPRPAVELRRGPSSSLRILAEIKKRSPSAGPLSSALSVKDRAACYERAGASLISVLCDSRFFDGKYEDLLEAREGCGLPLLCKEFVIDEIQLDHALAYGASAVLLIVRCLRPTEVRRLHEAAVSRGLVPLVEIATQEEVPIALDAGATLIGVNARDLDTLKMDPQRTATVLASLPKHITKLYLSGVATEDDVKRILAGPSDGALVGETLMRKDDPEAHLRSLVLAAAGTGRSANVAP